MLAKFNEIFSADADIFSFFDAFCHFDNSRCDKQIFCEITLSISSGNVSLLALMKDHFQHNR